MSYAVSGGYPGWPPVSAVAAEDPREEAAHWPVAAVSKGGTIATPSATKLLPVCFAQAQVLA